MSGRIRQTFYPSFYRVVLPSVAGDLLTDYDTLPQARRAAGTNGTVLACWYVKNEDGSRVYTLDTEVVR